MTPPRLSRLVAHFEQESDTEDSDTLGQDIEVELTDSDEGYLVIKTQRWAVDTPQEVMDLLERVLGMAKR